MSTPTKKRLRGSSAAQTAKHLSGTAQRVLETLKGEAIFSEGVIATEVDNFFNKLGLPKQYFEESPDTIAKHVASLASARIMAQASGRAFDIRLTQESDTSAMFAARSLVRTAGKGSTVRMAKGPDAESSPCRTTERYIEDTYLSGGVMAAEDKVTGTSGLEAHFSSSIPAESLSNPGTPAHRRQQVWRLQCYRSANAIQLDDETGSGAHLRLYFAQAPDFVNPAPADGETDIHQLGDKKFLATTSPEFLEYYQQVVAEASDRLGPSIRVFHTKTPFRDEGSESPLVGSQGGAAAGGGEEDHSLMLFVGFKAGSTHSYFTGISDVYRYHRLFAVEKFVEPFANGVQVFAFHLRALGEKGSVVDHRVADLVRDCSLHYVLPRTSLTPLLTRHLLSAQEVAYAYAAWKFAFHFLNRSGDELRSIEAELSKLTDGKSLALVGKVRKALRAHAFTEGSILDCMFRHPDVVSYLYNDFMAHHHPSSTASSSGAGAGSSPVSEPLTEAAVNAHLQANLSTELDIQMFQAMLSFNRAVVKTNFYRSVKTALSFRLDPAFLNTTDFPDRPHGLFFMIGSEFRGFHIRFRDVARGGIRVVRSAYAQAFANNVGNMFDECYNLANTQQRKNKDIPEGGSKGVILLNLAHQDKGQVAFQKYVDAVMDVLLPNDEVRDRLGQEEILFFGPDENTADFMDWAANHARKRGYKFWKAFTTGKSLALGGIPHDVYGMTTHSVRQYALGIQAKLGLEGSACTKVQTGGPDGDLGSNEILMGNEKTTAVVDGSGVLFDPAGIDPTELKRLAKNRQMVSHVDTSKISAAGALVLTSDKNKKLPDGTVVASGLQFRNLFHLSPLATGDFFIPCGGRPASVNFDNIGKFMYTADGQPRFKYVVEGANLFITQDARRKLEKAGVVLFKDASANKGGVTSSSLEVLAALVLTDDEFGKHMAVASDAGSGAAGGGAGAGAGAGAGDMDSSEDPATPPAFYQEYVKEVQALIDQNAQLEFECIWREHERSGIPRCELTDMLSVKITELSARIEDNDSLWANTALRSRVLSAAVPTTLANLLSGPDKVLARLPEKYQRALFASRLASRFIYDHGLQTPEFAFFEFVSKSVA